MNGGVFFKALLFIFVPGRQYGQSTAFIFFIKNCKR